MQESAQIIVWGIGQLGSVFSCGFLRLGKQVVPVTRASDVSHLALQFPAPELVLIAVGEDDLQAVLGRVPEVWRNKLALLQNELVPEHWLRNGISDPSIAVVWFEKKRDTVVRNVMPSRVFGPAASGLLAALRALTIPTKEVASYAELCFELALKNLYILTINCAGLAAAGTVSELWHEHRVLTEAVAREIIVLQDALFSCQSGPSTSRDFTAAKVSLDAERLLLGLEEAIMADPSHISRGRSAPERLRRAIEQARHYHLHLPELEQIAHGIAIS